MKNGVYQTNDENEQILSKEETMALFYKAKAGDEQAKEELLLHNMRLIRSIAFKKCSNGEHLDDAVQEGAIGFLQAIEHFDPDLNDNFSAYAIFWIQKYIYEFLRKDNLIVIPQKVYEKLSRIDQLTQQNPLISDEELCRLLSIETRELKDIESWRYRIVDEEDAAVSDENEDLLVKMMISDIMSKLSKQEQMIIEYYLGLKGKESKTFKQIAELMNLSVGTVHHRYNEAIMKLRENYDN